MHAPPAGGGGGGGSSWHAPYGAQFMQSFLPEMIKHGNRSVQGRPHGAEGGGLWALTMACSSGGPKYAKSSFESPSMATRRVGPEWQLTR